MKIAQVAPLIESVPPKKYGGTERVVHALTQELVKRGHDVTLFASGDSITSAKLVSVYPRNLREARMKDIYGFNIWTLMNIGTVYEKQEEFDIIHDHTGYLGMPTANLSRTPVVVTNHGPFSIENRVIFRTFKKPYVVTISQSQANSAINFHHAGTVYNGLYLENYPFSSEHDGYLLFVGRISMEKGLHIAIQVAQSLNLPLIIAAKLDPTDFPYYQEYIRPHLSPQIRWIGEVDEEKRNKLMSRALCFLHPVTWREPFGLTLIEAGATGCPVIGMSMGSIPEIVADEKTGFVVNSPEEMVDAVSLVATIDRAECRRHALENFSAEKMADGYEAIYRKILLNEI